MLKSISSDVSPWFCSGDERIGASSQWLNVTQREKTIRWIKSDQVWWSLIKSSRQATHISERCSPGKAKQLRQLRPMRDEFLKAIFSDAVNLTQFGPGTNHVAQTVTTIDNDTITHCVTLCYYSSNLWTAWVHELPARACASPGMDCALDLVPCTRDPPRSGWPGGSIPGNPEHLLFCSKALPQFLNRHLHDSVEASTAADEVIFRKYGHDSVHLLNWCNEESEHLLLFNIPDPGLVYD